MDESGRIHIVGDVDVSGGGAIISRSRISTARGPEIWIEGSGLHVHDEDSAIVTDNFRNLGGSGGPVRIESDTVTVIEGGSINSFIRKQIDRSI